MLFSSHFLKLSLSLSLSHLDCTKPLNHIQPLLLTGFLNEIPVLRGNHNMALVVWSVGSGEKQSSRTKNDAHD
jgi:hypothetical protein